VALFRDLTPILFQLAPPGIDRCLLIVELAGQLLLGCDQFATSFRVVFDQFFRGFGELMALFDDRLGLISHAVVLSGLFFDRLLGKFSQSLVTHVG
jgi:hypothetical protein